MAYSKVILNGTTLIDVTQKTVAADKLLNGYTALKNDGTDIVGAYDPPSTQSKTVSPSTSQQTVSPDPGFLLSSVTVNAMPSGSASTPSTTITANPTISVSSTGLITASVSGSKSVTPSVSAGYVASGTAGTVTVNGSNTQQLTVYNGEHHQPAPPAPSNYTVSISLTNPHSSSDFMSCTIYEVETSDVDWETYETWDENPIGTINSPTGSTTVSVSASAYGIVVSVIGNWGASYSNSNISCTGGVALNKLNWSGNSLFSVDGDGTIVINGIDYGD